MTNWNWLIVRQNGLTISGNVRGTWRHAAEAAVEAARPARVGVVARIFIANTDAQHLHEYDLDELRIEVER